MSNHRDLSNTRSDMHNARTLGLGILDLPKLACVSTLLLNSIATTSETFGQILPPISSQLPSPQILSGQNKAGPNLPSLPNLAVAPQLPEALPRAESLPPPSLSTSNSQAPNLPTGQIPPQVETLPAPQRISSLGNPGAPKLPTASGGSLAGPGNSFTGPGGPLPESGASLQGAAIPNPNPTESNFGANSPKSDTSKVAAPKGVGAAVSNRLGIRERGIPQTARLPVSVTQSDASLQDNSSDGPNSIIRLEPLPGSLESPVITAMAVSKDGTFIAAAGDDHAIRLISLADRKTHSVWTGHLDWIRGLAFTEDGDRLASCANDGFIRVWDTKSLASLSSTQVPHALDALTFADDDTIFAVGFGPSVYRVNANDGTVSVDHESDCGDLRSISVSPNHEYLAYAGRDGVLRIQKFAGAGDFTSPTIAWAASPIHFSRIRSVHFSEDSSTITTVGEDRKVVHFDIESKAIVSQTTVKGGKLMGLIPLSPDEFAVAGADNTIRIVGWNDATPQTKLVGHDGSVCVLQKTNRFLISAGFDTTIRIWDLERARLERDTEGRYMHPVAAQFEDSGASTIEAYVSAPVD